MVAEGVGGLVSAGGRSLLLPRPQAWHVSVVVVGGVYQLRLRWPHERLY